ncbi:MAG: fructose-bisphosphatase class III [Verrucomicrobiota bacterium]
MMETKDWHELVFLENLAQQYPSRDAAILEIAALEAQLKLPKPVVHVISDIHGEYKKLRHVVNNGSGKLRPLIDELFSEERSEVERAELLATIYYPMELMDSLSHIMKGCDRRLQWVKKTLRAQIKLARYLARGLRNKDVLALIDREWREFFYEMLYEPVAGRGEIYMDARIASLAENDRDLAAVRRCSRLVRNISTQELIVAGDLGDRGPRIDRVIDFLQRLPRVSMLWGNHDVSWMGACLGHEALIANVLRISLRYRRLFQLEEGYGLLLLPLEQLAQKIYGNDSAERFFSKGHGMRDSLLVARMQKAIAIIQFKLEGQLTQKYPEWGMEERNLLHRIDYEKGTVQIEGKTYELLDTVFPTIDPQNPYELSGDEKLCMDRLRQSFVLSNKLWHHMSWMERIGSMYTVRDGVVIFHACMPVDENGEWLKLEIDGQEVAGRKMYDAFDTIIRRAFRKGANKADDDIDWFWYLWAAPDSPLFGKDKMTTFEGYFVAEKETHIEKKNAYFSLIQEYPFCCRLGREMGARAEDEVLIVNGHVPVKVDEGEEPVKQSGNAVIIDGAFSEAYGDRGYTLVMGPQEITLAEHHHFESIHDVIKNDRDVIPKVMTILPYEKRRLVEDTEEGEKIKEQVVALKRLVYAYDEGLIREKSVK